MPILPKQTVQQLPSWPAIHSSRLHKARLDSGEHPEGFERYYPFGVSPAELIYTYPEYGVLLEKLARHLNVDVSNIMLSNGSDNGLALIAQTFIEPGTDRAICNVPSFVVIPHSLHLAGAWLNAVPVLADFSCDVQQVDRELKEHPTKLCIFASPDNPTGMMIDAEVVERWCANNPSTLFVIDEAYYEFTLQTVLPLIAKFDNLIVTRTFSKAWGMAGLRLGVLLGHPDLIASLARVRPLYDINSVAAETAIKLLDHKKEVIAVAGEIMAAKSRIVTRLVEAGLSVHEGHANFYLLDMGERAVEFGRYCAENDMLVRICAPNADPANVLYGKLRVSVGKPDENDRFVDSAIAFATT
jgi:histidinol-phosphate aminotransferase